MAGICCGVFVKKGLKAVAFLLGGAFVLLQYLSFQSISKTDFAALGSKYESAMDKLAGVAGKDGVTGAVGRAGNRVNRIGSRFIDFLMADFPPRGALSTLTFLKLCSDVKRSNLCCWLLPRLASRLTYVVYTRV